MTATHPATPAEAIRAVHPTTRMWLCLARPTHRIDLHTDHTAASISAAIWTCPDHTGYARRRAQPYRLVERHPLPGRMTLGWTCGEAIAYRTPAHDPVDLTALTHVGDDTPAHRDDANGPTTS